MNPAFTRIHPSRNVIYSCTESVSDNGEIVAWDICPTSGKLSFLSSADAHGTSTCYITIDKVRLIKFNRLNIICQILLGLMSQALLKMKLENHSLHII